MRNFRITKSLLLLSCLLAAFLYGAAVGKYQLFPYAHLVNAKDALIERLATTTHIASENPTESVTEKAAPAAPGKTPSGAPDNTGAMDQFSVEFERNYSGLQSSGPMTGAYEVVATDMDLDGDVDLLLNWHLKDVELYENTGPEFKLKNPVVNDYSGLTEEGNVSLYGSTSQIQERINDRAIPGIYVWHDDDFLGSWNVRVHAPESTGQVLTLKVRSNEMIEEFEGVGWREVDRDDFLQQREDAYAKIAVRIRADDRHIRFRASAVGSNIVLANDSAGDSLSTLPFFVGPQFQRRDPQRLSLRKSDPHGIAWVQVMDSPQPEIFIARGGNRGRLKPPFAAKRNRFFMYAGAEDSTYKMVPPAMVPLDYGRGRSVAWVDVDNDGDNELYLGNQHSGNALLVYDSEAGIYQDLASKYGLSFYCGDAFSWLDIDHDGWQDLVFLTCYNSIAIARNIKGKRFELTNGEDIGLTIARVGKPDADRIFMDATIVVLDVDLDGQLDIWVGGLGSGRQHRVFLRRDQRFDDATQQLGMDSIRQTQRFTFLDLENDGFPDLVTVAHDGMKLFRNRSGERFEDGRDVSALSGEELLSAVTSADLDGDRRQDIVVAGEDRWWVLANRFDHSNNSIRIQLRQDRHEPIGTLVKARYESGRQLVQRYGSAASNGISQSMLPLFFGSPASDPIEEFSVLWPGHIDWQVYDVPGTNNLSLVSP